MFSATFKRPYRSRTAVALAVAVSLGLVLAAPAAEAGKHGRKVKYYDDGYAYSQDYDYARVVDVQPVVTRVRVEEPRRECWEETRYEDPPPRRGVAGSMVLGGLIGGALGNQIGGGDGRRAATVAGAIIGSAIGHDVGERSRDRLAYGEPRAYTVEQCDTRYESRWEERVDGYDVVYEYAGRRYSTRLPYDPGRQLRIRVGVSPAEG